MGSCLSCCRGRRKDTRSGEHEPLLPPADALPPPTSKLDKTVDILGAVNAGKLPSQDQTSHILQLLLRSDILSDNAGGALSGYGPLSQSGRKVVSDVKELVEATLVLGIEKNNDDTLQALIFEARNLDAIPIRVDTDSISASHSKEILPSVNELSNDISNLSQSVKSLVKLLITSSAFRFIVSDLLLTLRDTIAGAAADIGTVALQIQVAAEDVQKATRLDDITIEGLKGKAKEAVFDVADAGEIAKSHIGTAANESVDDAKDVVIGRLQEVIVRAHQNPKYLSALNTILVMFRKYATKISQSADIASQTNISSIPTSIRLDDDLTNALSNLKTLLERLSSNHSLDPLLQTLILTITDIKRSPTDLQHYLTSLGKWLDRSLSQPHYITSRAGTRAAEQLFDTARILISSDGDSDWAGHLRTLMDQIHAFVDSLVGDSTTRRFVCALDMLSSDVLRFGQDAVVSGFSWKEELIKDVFGWLVPRILRTLRAVPVPMPRVEFQNGTIDVAVDALLLTSTSASASLMPDHMWMRNWSEIRVDMDVGEGIEDGNRDIEESPGSTNAQRPEPMATRVQSSTRIHVHMDGIRVSAHEIGYYVKYKGVIPYSDEGLLSIDVEHGLSIDIELETSTEDRRTDGQLLFKVLDVRVTIPGLKFSIDRSKHWVINKLLVQPLSGPVVRTILGRVMEAQIRSGLERLEGLMGEIRTEAASSHSVGVGVDSTPSLNDYWNAALVKIPLIFTTTPVEPIEPAVQVESHTTATLKGIIHTTITTQPDPDESDSTVPPDPAESILAIGGGAQLFPNKGGPYGEHEDTANDLVEEVIDAVEEGAEIVKAKTSDVVEGAIEVRQNIERADERRVEREHVEGLREGWRSCVFDW